MMKSTRWRNWVTVITPTTCVICLYRHGKIYPIDTAELILEGPPVHDRCRCSVPVMEAKAAGTASSDGRDGADYWVRYRGHLPGNYITYEFAQAAGWKPVFGNLRTILPGATIGGGVFRNDRGKLPAAPGRVWYEADIDYKGFWRGTHRIVYSNDGLIFATYNHYKTFVEIL